MAAAGGFRFCAADRKSPEKDVGGARCRARRARQPPAVAELQSRAASLQRSVTPQRTTIALEARRRAQGYPRANVENIKRGRSRRLSGSIPRTRGETRHPGLSESGGLYELI